MTIHWLDGVLSLDLRFWKVWIHHPIDYSPLVVLVFAVALRDFILWVFKGNNYLEED